MIRPGEVVVVGVSGGVDSVCLLHLLHRLNKSLPMVLVAVHVNHMLRGADADRDCAFVRDRCAADGIRFISERIDVASEANKRGLSLEAAGRAVRYQVFREAAQGLQAEYHMPVKVAVAHHKDDLAETVLLNILRGTGVDGLTGMRLTSRSNDRYELIRPLLNVDRAKIEEYCRRHGLDHVEDDTNRDQTYTRNWLRLDLLPKIREQVNPNIAESLATLSGIAGRDRDYLETAAKAAYDRCVVAGDDVDPMMLKAFPQGVFFSQEELRLLHPAILTRLVRTAAENLRTTALDIYAANLFDAERFIREEEQSGKEICLPGGLRLAKNYRWIVFHQAGTLRVSTRQEVAAQAGTTQVTTLQEKAAQDGTTRICTANVPGLTDTIGRESGAGVQHISGQNGGVLIKSFLSGDCEKVEELKNIGYNPLVQYFDAESIDLNRLVLRTRRRGDRFFPLKSVGSKKLKDYFIDNKIPGLLRDEIPVLAIGQDVVWVVGFRIADPYKITDYTKTVLKLQYIGNNMDAVLIARQKAPS